MNAVLKVIEPEVLSGGQVIRVARAKARVVVLTDDSDKRADRRVMNHMDPLTRGVHIRLEHWGQATRQAIENGWPQVTLLGRMIVQGPSGASQTGHPPVTLSEEDQHTDAAVAKLGEIDRRVITLYYHHWVTVDQVARQMRMRIRQTQNVLRRARWRVSGFLLALESK